MTYADMNNGIFAAFNRLNWRLDFMGINFTVYTWGIILGTALTGVYEILSAKKHGIKPWKALVIFLLGSGPVFLLTRFVSWLETGMVRWGASNGARAYVLYPLIFLVCGAIVREKPKKVLDHKAYPSALGMTFTHAFCAIEGCCYGYPCAWGVWNPKTDSFLFPIQFIETLGSLAVFFILIAYGRRHGYDTDGKVYPLFFIIFGIERFLCELLRDNPKVFWYVSDMALIMLFTALVGAVWLMIIRKKEKAEAAAQA